MMEAPCFHAQLLFINGFLLHGVLPPPGYSDAATFSRIVSREPPQRFSCFSAVFFFPGWSFMPRFNILSEIPLISFSVPSQSLSIDSFPLQTFGHASHLYLPSRHKHSVSSVCFCLLLQLTADLCTTLAIFIFLICNFCSSDLVRADSTVIRNLSITLTNWTQTTDHAPMIPTPKL